MVSPKDESNNGVSSTINEGSGSLFLEPQVGAHLVDKSPFMSSDDQIFGTNESLRPPEKRADRQRKDQLLLPLDHDREAADTWVSHSARAAHKRARHDKLRTTSRNSRGNKSKGLDSRNYPDVICEHASDSELTESHKKLFINRQGDRSKLSGSMVSTSKLSLRDRAEKMNQIV